VRLRRRKPWTLSALAARRDALDDRERWCELMLSEGPPAALRDLQSKCLLRTEEMSALLERLRASGRVIALPGGKFTHSSIIQQTAERMLAAVQMFHTANPQRNGMSREELFAAVGGIAELCELAAVSLIRSRQLGQQGAVFARAGWSARVSDRDQQLSNRVAAAFQAAGWAGPTAAELAAKLAEPPARVEKATRLLAEQAVLVRLDERTYVHRDALESARQKALGLFSKKPSFSTMDFRDALGVSRKYAVPLLDYLDRMRFTVRSGHDRTPGIEARKLMK
jgi:selenocysteine-specific elongation factor